ncbi:hypothetical protein JCM6882_005606, partial [Rhodosporidiobolus microsporus]
MRGSGPILGLPTAPKSALTLLDSLSSVLKSVTIPPTRQHEALEIISQLREIYASGRAVDATIVSSTLNNPTDHPTASHNLPSLIPSAPSRRPATFPSSASVVPDSQGGGFDCMGGVLGTVAVLQPIHHSPNDADQLLQHPNDLPPREGVEASSPLSPLPEGGWTLVTKLTNAVTSIVERLERLELPNRYANLPLDAAGPPAAAAPSPYAVAVAEPARPPPLPTSPPAPRNRPPATPAATPAAKSRIRDEVSKHAHDLPPALVHATRLERGDVQVVAKTPSAAALLRRVLPLAWPMLETVDRPEQLSVVLHRVRVEVEKDEVEAALVKACGEEGAVRRVVGLPVREGASMRSVVAELWNAKHVSRLLEQKFLPLRPGVWADVERARSRAEQHRRSPPAILPPSFTNSASAASGATEVTATVVHDNERADHSCFMQLELSPGPSPAAFVEFDGPVDGDWSRDAACARGEAPPCTPNRRALDTEGIAREVAAKEKEASAARDAARAAEEKAAEEKPA